MAKENDIYYGDLMLLKKRVSEWSELHPKSRIIKFLKLATVVICFGMIFGAYFYDPVAASKSGLSLFTVTIAVAFIIMILVGRKINSTLQPPFRKLYNARFEASDEGIICYFQQQMAEYRYFIKDKNIKEWVVDKLAHCMYIEGNANFSMTTKEGSQNLGTVDAFYMLIPFDDFDLADLIEPYGDLVQIQEGTLRARFETENTALPCIIREKKTIEKNKKKNSKEKSK